MDFITIDFETATPERNSPCEIGLTFVENNQIKEVKSWLIKPICYPYFDDFCVSIHGITPKDVKNSPEFVELWKEIEPLIKHKFLIAHNAGFDSSFLKASMDRYNIYWIFGFRTVDLHTIAYIDLLKRKEEIPLIYGTSALSLNKILEIVGLPKEPDPHNALNGAKYETEAVYRLVYGISGLNEFKNYPIPIDLAKVKQTMLF